MRRRNPKPTEPQAIQNFRQTSIDAAVALCFDRMTFQKLADALGRKHEFVRSRLTRTPWAKHLLVCGKEYQVPLAIAVQFVKEVYTTARVVKADKKAKSVDPLMTATNLKVGIDWRNNPNVELYKFTFDEPLVNTAEFHRLIRSIKISRVAARRTKAAGGSLTPASGL